MTTQRGTSTASARIVILHHENQPRDSEPGYLASAMGTIWQSWGHEVRHQYGIEHPADADLVLLHLDLSVVPADYVDYAAQFPAAVNIGLQDIRKRTISRNLVVATSDYSGPVIVKTDLNHGGTPEVRLGLKRPRSLVTLVLRRLGVKDPSRMVCPEDYRVYADKQAVPARVFDDPSLVVERFLGEEGGSGFVHRRYLFLGDVEVHQAWSGRRAVNYEDHAQAQLELEPPPANLQSLRAEFGADYGKFDYALVDGEAQVFDVNRTPAGWCEDPVEADARWARDVSSALAPGIRRWLG